MALATANYASCGVADWLTVWISMEEAFGINFLICSSLRVMSWFTSIEIFTIRNGLGFKLQGIWGLWVLHC